MKKMLLSAAAFAVVAVSAVAVAPTTSEAIPAFARQTGAACLSCHFQSFPSLTAFGRSFKYNAFTDVGEEALIEDDNLSIPSVLNATFVVRGSIDQIKDVYTGAVGVRKYTDYAFPRDAVLLMAGRIGSNTGAFVEFNGGAANWQLMNSFDMGGAKIGLNIANTGFGWTAPLEVSNVHGQHGGLMNGKNVSAVNQINGLAGNSLGVAAWAANDMFNIQAGLYAPVNEGTGVTGRGIVKNTPAFGVRAFATPEVGGMEAGIGFGYVGGKVANGNLNANATAKADYNMWFIDGQLQGDMGDTQFGLYADYAVAPSKATGNIFANAVANQEVKGYSVRATVKPLHNLVFALGYGELKKTLGATTVKQKSTLAAAEYELYQNAVIALIYESVKNPWSAAFGATGNTGTNNRLRLEWEALL